MTPGLVYLTLKGTEVWEVAELPLGVLLPLSRKDLLTDHQVLGSPLHNLATLYLNGSLQPQAEAEAHRPIRRYMTPVGSHGSNQLS